MNKIITIGIVALVVLQSFASVTAYKARNQQKETNSKLVSTLEVNNSLVQELVQNSTKKVGSGDYLPTSFKATTVSAVSVTTSSTLVQATTSSPYRVIVNNGDYPVYLALNGDAPAVVNEGIKINAGGGSYEIISNQNPYFGAIRAISSGGTSVVTLTSY